MVNKFLNIFKFIARLVLPKIVVVGIDIQEHHVAMVASTRHLDRGGDYVSGVEALPDGTIVGGEVKNPHTFFNILQKLMSQIPISKLKHEPVIVFSVPPMHMYTELAMFPLMTAEALEEAVRLKLETSLPWPLEETYVDWKMRKLEDVSRIGIFIAAVSKQFLDGYLKVFQRGGWRVAVAEFHLLSLAHAGRLTEEQGTHLFVLLDEDGAEFGVFRNGDLMAHFIKTVSPNDAVAPEAQNSVDTKIIFETKRLVAHAETELGLHIEGVMLFNKVGLQTQMEQLQKEIDLPVRFFSPSENPALHIALGASACIFGTPEHSVNFVPKGSGGRYNENLILRTLSLWANAMAVAGAVMVFTFVGFWLFLRGQATLARQEAAYMSSALNNKVAYSSDLVEFAKDFNTLTEIAALAETYRTNVSVRVLAVLGEAKRYDIKVGRIWKESLQEQSFRAEIESPTRDALLNFKKGLEAMREEKSLTSSEATSSDTEASPLIFAAVNIPVIQFAKETDIALEVEFVY